MIEKLLETLNKQRLVWSWGVVVGLFLVFVGHAPVLPVIAGCLLAVTISVLRSTSKNGPRPIVTRGGR
jgi:hypothetical protein